MKRTFLAIVMTGSSMAMFAQTNPVTPVNPTTPTSPTTPATTSPTTSPATSTPATSNSVTNSTTDPMNTTTNHQVNVNTNTSNLNSATNTASYPSSTSWAPGTSPYWGWNGYGIWDNNTATGSTTPITGSDFNSSTANNNSTSSTAATTGQNTGGTLNSNDSYSAYAGTAVSSLPYSVQTNFGKDYPNLTNNQYAWNQYGDWFSTYYSGKGRLTQYFYDQRGSGYSLSLPVVQTYVPEEVIDKALQKYGAHLYSIGMVKTTDGNSAYQIGLLNHGQLHNEYLNEQGASVADVWRTEEVNMSSTSANAAMDTQNSVNVSEANTDDKNVSAYQDTTGKPKMKMKTKNGKMKMKPKGHKSSTDSTSTSPAMKEQ